MSNTPEGDYFSAHGGGRGSLITAILSKHTSARGVLFERPAVAEVAATAIAAAGLQDRCDVIQGDFFTEVPPSGDIYLLKKVIHDWTDDQAIEILRRCRAAMRDEARLVIAEFILPDHDGPSPIKWQDLLMMVYTGGRERTELEYADLLASADFALERVISTEAAIGLMVARYVYTRAGTCQ